MRAAEAGRTLELQVNLVYTAGSRLSRGCTVRPCWKEGREGEGRKGWNRRGGREEGIGYEERRKRGKEEGEIELNVW